MQKIKKIKKNIQIREDFVIYNTKTMFDDCVKIPSYVIQEIMNKERRIMIRFNGKYLNLYTPEELKSKLVTVESRVYDGWFKAEKIKYNLVLVKVG